METPYTVSSSSLREGITDLVTFFPDWRGDPYLDDLARALTNVGWHCEIVGRKGLMFALIAAIGGRGTVHLHWFEGFTPQRNWLDGLVAWLYLPALWLTGRRGRLIWTVHNVTPHDGYAPLVGTRFLTLLARSSSRVIVHFDETREAVVRRFSISDKVYVIRPADFGHSHGPPVSRVEARAKVLGQLREEGKLFVQIGSLRRYKQPATTVAAFRDAAPPSATLLVAGPCDDAFIMTDVRQAAGGDSRIILKFGRLSDEDLVISLCAADWSVCPYLHIDNPGAVNLSVAYGCPVIAPAFPQISVLTMGHDAILYRTDGLPREHLTDAIAEAASEQRTPAGNPGRSSNSRRKQAEDTSRQYLAARRRQAG